MLTTTKLGLQKPEDSDAFDQAPFNTNADTIDSGVIVGKMGKSIIATTESRTNVAYGTLTTPDQVTGIVLPTDSLLCVVYQATWQESVTTAARAAIFVGSNQTKVAAGGAVTAAGLQEAFTSAAFASVDAPLASCSLGLISAVPNAATNYTGDVTTGQIVGVANGNLAVSTLNATGLYTGGPSYIFAAAGTYTISVQFKSTSGSVTVKNRKLWVWSMQF